MQQNSIPLAPPDLRVTPTFLTSSWEFIGLHDNALLCLSLVLLLLSTIDPGPFGFIVRLCWLASFVALTFINIGAGLAAYIGSLAIYAPLRVRGWSSLLERPDNYAVAILFIAMLFLVLNRQEARPRFLAYIVAFLMYCSLNVVLLAPTQFPALFRTLAIPLLACVLLTMISFRERELKALLNGMAILGGYMGLVSMLEGLHVADWILPPWIGDRSVIPYDQWIAGASGSGQSGGTLLFPAFNGLLLSLIFVMLILRARRGGSWFVYIAMLLCAAGAFLTLERGVWLGLALALFCFPGWCCSVRQANIRRAALVCFAAVFVAGVAGVAGDRLRDTDTILYRFALWGAGLRLFMAHPVVGIGFFNFGTASAGAEQGFGSQLLDYRAVNDEAASHNTFLTVLVEFGIVGFLFYATVFFKLVQSARNNASRLWGRSGKAWVLAFAIVYLFNAMFISAFEGATNTAFFAVLGAIAGAQVE